MKIVLYTIDCPACLVLEKKLIQANLEFDVVRDEQILKEKGLVHFPILEIDGLPYSLKEANDWLKEYKNGN